MPLFDIFWTMLWFFLFFIWIWLLISIFGDIFRSKDLSGWAKAIWSIFIIVLPLIGALTYIIVRGESMGDRTAEAYAAREQATRQYIKEAAGSSSTADELSKLAELKNSGVISEEEFQTQKSKLLT